jgi:hypothetical protein
MVCPAEIKGSHEKSPIDGDSYEKSSIKMDETNADFPTLGPTSWALVCASYVWENPRELAITRLGTLG